LLLYPVNLGYSQLVKVLLPGRLALFLDHVATIVEHTNTKSYNGGDKDEHHQFMVKHGSYAPATAEKSGDDNEQVSCETDKSKEECEICKYVSHDSDI
jgi:hypothetical protein